jgi:hypothetical protein
MVHSIRNLTDSQSLLQLAARGRTAAAGSSDSIASLVDTAQSGTGKDASTLAIPSILDNSQTQSASGDFSSAFQRLSSSLQSMMVQLQSSAPSSADAAGTATASTATAGTATDGATTDTPVASLTGSATTATSGTEDMASVHHSTGGNRALQGDASALINDLHGFIQVANGDATVTTDGGSGLSTANDNVATSTSTAATVTAASSDAATQAAAADRATTNALSDMTYNFAQNLFQAVQNYSAASSSATVAQRSPAVSAVG